MTDPYMTFEHRLRHRVEDEIRTSPEGKAILWRRWRDGVALGLFFIMMTCGFLMLSVGIPLFALCGHELFPADIRGLRTLSPAGSLLCLTLLMNSIALVNAGSFWGTLWRGQSDLHRPLLYLPVDDDARFRLELAEIAGKGMILGTVWFAVPTMLIVAYHAGMAWSWAPLIVLPALLQGLVVAAVAVLALGRVRSVVLIIAGLSCFLASLPAYVGMLAVPALEALAFPALLLQLTGWPSLLFIHGILDGQILSILWLLLSTLLIGAAVQRVRRPFRLREILVFPDGTLEALPTAEWVHLKGVYRIHRFDEPLPRDTSSTSSSLSRSEWSQRDRVMTIFRRFLTRREEHLTEAIVQKPERWDLWLGVAGLGLVLCTCLGLIPDDADGMKGARAFQFALGCGLSLLVLSLTAGSGLPTLFEKQLPWAWVCLPVRIQELIRLSFKAWTCNFLVLTPVLILACGSAVLRYRASGFDALLLIIKVFAVIPGMVLASLIFMTNVHLSTSIPWYRRLPDVGSLFLFASVICFWILLILIDSWWIVLSTGMLSLLLLSASLRFAVHYLHRPGVDWNVFMRR